MPQKKTRQPTKFTRYHKQVAADLTYDIVVLKKMVGETVVLHAVVVRAVVALRACLLRFCYMISL